VRWGRKANGALRWISELAGLPPGSEDFEARGSGIWIKEVQMLIKLRQRMAREESGFTLVELLVVMLILGLLAAIAIPSFFNQRNKAKDASAKEAVRTLQTSIETYATDNDGKYTGADAGAATDNLNVIEPSLNDVGTRASVVAATDNSYTVQVTSDAPSANDFNITRTSGGITSLTCTTVSTDGCPASGTWG
jgi:type IV pilus assembly protein PilA